MGSFVLYGGGPPSQRIRLNKNALLTSLEVTQQFYSNELPRLPLDILTAYCKFLRELDSLSVSKRNTDMRRLTTGIRSVKSVIGDFVVVRTP